MAIIIPDMPEDIHNSLLNNLELSHPGVLEVMIQRKGAEKAKFQHVHYQYWNRYHIKVNFFFFFMILRVMILLQGNGVPSDVDPAALKRAGTKGFNTSQTMPRTSIELQKNCQSYMNNFKFL